jgi:hypothetical protein
MPLVSICKTRLRTITEIHGIWKIHNMILSNPRLINSCILSQAHDKSQDFSRHCATSDVRIRVGRLLVIPLAWTVAGPSTVRLSTTHCSWFRSTARNAQQSLIYRISKRTVIPMLSICTPTVFTI